MNKIRPELADIRTLYAEAENDASKAATGLRLTGRISDKSAVTLAYKGAFEALQAKFSWNAVYQFNQVNKAMKLLDRAVELDSENPEIRYLRYSVNFFLPVFLQKNASLEADKMLLLEKFPYAECSPEIREQITRFLSERVNLKVGKKDLPDKL